MDSSIIAVRVANGSFVSILDTSSQTRRRLVLTTIRDQQTSVQIDLYRGVNEDMENAEYVGSLMIENIESAAKGQPDIALLLGVDESGNLNATATDKKSGEYQSLSVSLESVEQGGDYSLPDFELSDEELTLDDLSMDETEIALDDSAASLSLGDIALEEDPSLDVDAMPATDTLAAPMEEEGVLESSAGAALTGLEEFSDDMVSLDESLGEEFDDQGGAESAFVSEELSDLTEDMVEADLGDEDFKFDDVDSELSDDLFSEDETSEDSEIAAATLDAAPEIDGNDGFEADDAQSMDEFPQLDDATVPADYAASTQQLVPRRSNAIVFVGYLILSLAALGVLTYLVFRVLEGPPAPALRASSAFLLALLPVTRGNRWRVSRRVR